MHAGWEVPGDWLTLGLWEPVVLEVEEREVGMGQWKHLMPACEVGIINAHSADEETESQRFGNVTWDIQRARSRAWILLPVCHLTQSRLPSVPSAGLLKWPPGAPRRRVTCVG